MDISILGELEINDGTALIDVGGERERAIVETLALSVGEVVTVETLVDGAWGDDPPPSADKSLQSHISRIRRRLPDGLVETVGHGYRLRLEPPDVDAHRLVRLIEDARRASTGHDPHFAAALLDEAVELWRGEPLADLADGPYRAGQIAWLEANRDLATTARIDAHLALGHHELMIPELERLVNEYPYREQLWSQLMVALYRAGRRTDALRCYERMRTGLREELGLNPSAAVRDVAARIAGEDARLDLQSPPPVSTLPTPLSSFVGRGPLMRTLSDLLDTHRLVTVLGPGGVGKTRIAIEAASELEEQWPDGTFFLELTGADEIDDVLSDLVSAVPWILEGGTGSHQHEVLERSLAGRSVLLVFDGAERLADPLGDFVEHLLETAPHVTALVTSRSPLHVPGEQLLEVSPMELPEGDRMQGRRTEAVELFLDRLGTAPDTLTANEIAAIEELCRLVDGLPLGIELVAAQAARIPVTATLAQLRSDQQAVLAMHRSDARDSDPSLELVLERTMQLLTPSQRTLLGRLAVFRAGFDMSGVRAITRSDVVEDFGRLCEVALVVLDPRSGATRRFRLLDTTRAFATRLLKPGESVMVARSHAEYFRSFARHASDQLDGPAVLRRLHREASNLRAALRWFLANDPGGAIGFGRALPELAETWLDRTEAVALFEQLLAAADHDPGTSESDRAWIEVGIGWPLFLTGNAARAIELTEDAAAAFSSIGDRSGACQALANRAHMELLGTANQELASVWYRRALDELGDAAHPHLRATVLVEAAQSLILADLCDERVDQMLDEAEGILREFHDHHRLAHLAMDRSLAAYATGDLDAVAEFARMNLRESRLAGTRIFAQIGETALGVQHLHTNDLDGGLDHLRTAVGMAREQGNVLQVGIALQAVAVHHALTGRIAEAQAIWTTARSLAPLWPLFGRRYPELMGPQLTQQLDDAFTANTADGNVVPVDRLVDSVLDESSLAPST